MKVLILCGGNGMRLRNEADYIPKSMVKLGHKPVIWHVMKRYSLYGYNEFVLALGEKGDLIRNYFVKYKEYVNDLLLNLGTGQVKDLTKHQENDWLITFAETGDAAMTGSRIAQCRKYIDAEVFMVSYSDCLADIDIKKLLEFHKKSKKIATITGVTPPYREGEFLVRNGVAQSAYIAKMSKNDKDQRLYNGGFMVFERKIFSYLDSFNECKLESEVFTKLMEDGQLAVYPHDGAWRWLDSDRDYNYLNHLVEKNEMFWLQNK